VVPTLPLHPRNRLAALVLAALHDGEARQALQRLASGERDAGAWLRESQPEPGSATGDGSTAGDGWAARARERARRAGEALEVLPRPIDPGLTGALAAAAALFDAGLGFEAHEVLEPHWMSASGAAREALQGLIQVAVGYQHLANGNLAGARSLLDEGAARLERGQLDGYGLRAFAVAVRATIPALPAARVPPFPRVAPA